MPPSVIEAAIDKIRDLIISGRLKPGSRLPPENVLAQELGLSRSSAREAVRALVTARVLDVRRGDGTYVTSLRPELLLEGLGFAADLMQDESTLELAQVRRILEPAATALAATTSDRFELQAIGQALDRMRAAEDYEELVRWDAQFHDLVSRASGNETLASMLRGVSSRTLRGRVWRGIMEEDVAGRTVAEHERIYEALCARDPGLAEAAALLHVGTTETWLRRVLRSRPEGDEAFPAATNGASNEQDDPDAHPTT